MNKSDEPIIINGLDLNAIIDEIEQWLTFLNTVIGMLSFTLALACLGTNTPAINAFFSFIIVILAVEQEKRSLLGKTRKLRAAAKDNEKADIILKGIEQKYLSIPKLIFKSPIYLMGFGLLLCVIISPFVFNEYPYLTEYFNL
ncbi:hypothetical protein [Endozoicomonas arenosclerae]|uniref:hypothetical protein n=1 Tax=Endozoicomonas arenosclerae TaxID=1633495 RepID=UPI000780A116|nr:hypothetical protein [Endozoicomonas arenosclerae]